MNGYQKHLMVTKISQKPDGNTDIIVDEYAAHIIKKVFELYATGAYSMELLCKKIKRRLWCYMGQGLYGQGA